ncbi:MAG TPA: hypothetical protein VG052_06800 [Puia sp.]|jgi:hypothetical protein|nr:hypothetical protein [Puia sp.]
MEQLLIRKNPPWIDWITMFLLIGNTANPFFYQSVEMLSLSFVILLVLWFLKEGEGNRLNQYFWTYVIVLTILQASQTLVYHFFPLKTFLGEYLRIAFAVMALRILGQRFFHRFVQFVYVFALISLCFYIPCMLIKPLGPFLIQHVAKYTMAPFTHAGLEDTYISRDNLILFNLGQIDLHRNSGFYWEPGTHGGFLVMALFINLFYRKEKLTSPFNILFALTILTTLSTTTYLALFFVILVYLKNFFVTRPWISLLVLFTVIGSAALLYNKLDFLNEKINKQIEKGKNGTPGESRFSSFMADVNQMSEHPLVGSGRNIEMKYGKNFYNVDLKAMHRNNGVGVLLGTYGILFFFFFFYYTWRSFYKLLDNKVNATMGLVLILIIGFSEDYFFKAFFIALALYCGVTDFPVDRVWLIRTKKLQLGRNTMTYEYD